MTTGEVEVKGQSGAVVADVRPGSAAENAGLQQGDLIQEMDRQPVRSADDLTRIVRGLKSGTTAALVVRRQTQTFFVPIEVP